MADDVVEPNDPVDEPASSDEGASETGLSRKDRAAARRAEFEARKAAKEEEKSSAKGARAEERAALKEAKREMLEQAKAAKEAARTAKKEAKAAAKIDRSTQDATAEDEQSSSRRTRREKKPKKEKPKKEKPKKEKPAKPEKDPYRPRFATAPTKVRAFTIFAVLFAVVHAVGALLLLLETTASPILGVLPEDAAMLGYIGAAVACAAAALWVVSASLLCAGRLLGKHLGIVALVVGLPLSLVAAPLLLSSDVRDWAL